MAEFNPYAAPEAEIVPSQPLAEAGEGRGVWADGKILVMAKVAVLPSRCVKCNEPAAHRLRRNFTWLPGTYTLLLLLSLWPYLIAYLIVRKTATVAVPICDAHRAGRGKMFLINWIVGLAGIPAMFAVAIDERLTPLVWVGLLMIVGSLIFAAIKSPILIPKRIDKTHAWFKGAGPAFLDSLPPLPAPVVDI